MEFDGTFASGDDLRKKIQNHPQCTSCLEFNGHQKCGFHASPPPEPRTAPASEVQKLTKATRLEAPQKTHHGVRPSEQSSGPRLLNSEVNMQPNQGHQHLKNSTITAFLSFKEENEGMTTGLGQVCLCTSSQR